MGQYHRANNTPAAATPASGTDERRSVCRYSVVQEDAWLGWWEKAEYRTTACKIVDLSLRGAKLTVAALPPRDTPLYFCPPGVSNADEWIEVKLVDARKRLFGAREVRVCFRNAFPYEVFKTVVYGPDAFQPSEHNPCAPAESVERDWW